MSQYHFTPETYAQLMADEVPAYGRLQDAVARHTTGGGPVTRVLDLGVGTGVTARAVLAMHPAASVVGIDCSAEMLAAARTDLGSARVALRRQRLEDALPPGPFDLVVSVLAIHHLTGREKADLFRRVSAVLVADGRFVFGDVVVPATPVDRPTPLSPRFDLPDTVSDQLRWLADAGFTADCVWTAGDLAVVSATPRPAAHAGGPAAPRGPGRAPAE